MVKVVFSSHARWQLAEWKISEREVLEAIEEPDNITQQPSTLQKLKNIYEIPLR